jgi:hypothetical protein
MSSRGLSFPSPSPQAMWTGCGVEGEAGGKSYTATRDAGSTQGGFTARATAASSSLEASRMDEKTRRQEDTKTTMIFSPVEIIVLSLRTETLWRMTVKAVRWKAMVTWGHSQLVPRSNLHVPRLKRRKIETRKARRENKLSYSFRDHGYHYLRSAGPSDRRDPIQYIDWHD